MTAEEGWVPAGVDTSKANIARVYDYWLGGSHNFLADQDAARVMIAVEPNTRAVARANRAFLGRAVRYLAEEAGIRQFLDIGSGIPTAQNVHQVAQQAAAGSRVVYADIDPVAVAHSRAFSSCRTTPAAAVIRADLREPEAILAAPETQLLIDFSQPVAVLLVAVLHFIPDEADPWQIVATLRDALAPGSYLVLVQMAPANPGRISTTRSRPPTPAAWRPACSCAAHPDVLRFFDGFTLIDPGLVYLPNYAETRPTRYPRTHGNSGAWLALAAASDRRSSRGGVPRRNGGAESNVAVWLARLGSPVAWPSRPWATVTMSRGAASWPRSRRPRSGRTWWHWMTARGPASTSRIPGPGQPR